MTLEVAAYILAVTNVVSFLLSGWGALFILWGAAKAARRAFWTEAEPWKGLQVPKLEEIRTAFGHRLLLGLEFFLAGDIIRLLLDPSLDDLIRLSIIVVTRVVLSFVITREVRLPILEPKLRSATRARV